MTGWIATALALAAMLWGLLGQPPEGLVYASGVNAPFIFASGLLLTSAIAFYLGYRVEQWNVSRQAAMWVSAFAIVAILSANIGRLLQGPGNTIAAAKAPAARQVTQKVKKRRKAARVLLPDTPKINRVERNVTADPENPLAATTRSGLVNRITRRDEKLPDDWKPSPEEREKFARFLRQHGLQYDPATAFKMTPPGQSSGGPQLSQ